MLHITSKKLKGKKGEYEINITGKRDYRSPDVDILVKMDSGKIELTIPKSSRCYGYEKTIEEQGYTKLVFT